MDFLETQCDLQEILKDDAEGFTLRQMQDKLTAMAAGIRQHMDAGLTEQDYAVGEALLEACNAAEGILNAQWHATRASNV